MIETLLELDNFHNCHKKLGLTRCHNMMFKLSTRRFEMADVCARGMYVIICYHVANLAYSRKIIQNLT